MDETDASLIVLVSIMLCCVGLIIIFITDPIEGNAQFCNVTGFCKNDYPIIHISETYIRVSCDFSWYCERGLKEISSSYTIVDLVKTERSAWYNETSQHTYYYSYLVKTEEKR